MHQQDSHIFSYAQKNMTILLMHLPISYLSKLNISRKLAISTFQWHESCLILSSGNKTAGFGIRAAGEIFLLEVHFPMLILDNLGMLLTCRKNLLLGKLIIFESYLLFGNS